MGNSCGRNLQKNIAGKYSGKFLWENSGGIACSKCCRKLLQEKLVGNCCGELLRENLEGNCCGKNLWEDLVRKSCGKILWENLAGNVA